MLEVRVLTGDEVRVYVEQVREIHDECFPEDVDGDDPGDENDDDGNSNDDTFWDHLAACHDTENVRWFLLMETKGDETGRLGDTNTESDTSTSAHSSLPEKEASKTKSNVLGFAACTKYAKCAYGMHLAVHPRHRGQGHGAWLMREVQSWAFKNNFTQMQASVAADKKKLINYYKKLGAYIVVGNSMGGGGGSNSSKETVVRIARGFDGTLCDAELAMSRTLGRNGGGNKKAAKKKVVLFFPAGLLFGALVNRFRP